KRVNQLSGAHAILHRAPPFRLEQIAVRGEKRVAQGTLGHHEWRELLGKDVMLRHGKPRLCRELVVRRPWGREPTEATVGQRCELIVVIEDYAAVAADAEVLQQQVTGENIGGCEIFDGLAVIENCRL